MGLFGRDKAIPPPSGASAIGTLRFDVKGPARIVPVQAWYPARPTNEPTEPYLDDVVRAALAGFTHVPKFLLPKNPSFSRLGALVERGRFPVLLFNHGFGSFQKQSTSLMEELASHGFVALSVGHPTESLVVQLADGTAIGHDASQPAWVEITAGVKQLEQTTGEVEPLLAQARAAKDLPSAHAALSAIAAHRSYAVLMPVLARWREDTLAVLDQLEHGPLGASLDPTRVGVFGHSLGGIVAGQLAMADERVRAGMNFDGAQLMPVDGPSTLRAPFCFLYADAAKIGRVTLRTEGMNDALLTSGGLGAMIRGAGHLNFTDMNNLSMMARALGSIDRGEMAKVLRAATVGFFAHHLKGAPLTGLTPSATLVVTARA